MIGILNDNQFFLAVFCEAVLGYFARLAQFKHNHTVALLETLFEARFNFYFDDVQYPITIPNLENGILKSRAVFAQEFGKLGAQFVVADVVRYDEHVYSFRLKTGYSLMSFSRMKAR